MNKLEKQKLNIRKARKEDLRAIVEISINSWQTAYRGIIDNEFLDNLNAEEIYQKRLKNYTKDRIVIAELNNEILGYCTYRMGNHYENKFSDVDCEICALYVDQKYKRKGIGKKIVDYVINEFKENGCNQMIIWCLKDNYPSRAFFEKIGGIYCGEKATEIGNKEYEEAGYKYNLDNIPVK